MKARDSSSPAAPARAQISLAGAAPCPFLTLPEALRCPCRLKGCLRQVNDTASRVVGQAFFNVIQVPCFEFTYREQCVEPYLYIW